MPRKIRIKSSSVKVSIPTEVGIETAEATAIMLIFFDFAKRTNKEESTV